MIAEVVEAEVIETDQSIVKTNNALGDIEDINYAVSQIQTQKDVAEYIKKLKKLEQLLKAANEFRSMATKYIRLEASVYSRIVDLGMVDSVPTTNYGRRIVEWFSSITEEQRNIVIDECADRGMTINSYWKNVIHERDMVEREIQYMESEGQYAIEAFIEKGEVKLSSYLDSFERANSRVPRDIYKGYKDNIRNKIRELGGHGLGDGEGTYMTREKAAEASNEIVRNKVKSIASDIDRLKEFLDGGQPLDLPIKTKHTSSFDLNSESSINLMLALCGVGNTYFETQQNSTRAKICARLLNRLGTNPYELFGTLINFSIQRHGQQLGGLIDLTHYGWPEEEAQKIQKHYEEIRANAPDMTEIFEKYRG